MRFEIHVHVLYICKLHNKYMLNMPMFLTFRTVCFLFNWYIFTYSLITQGSDLTPCCCGWGGELGGWADVCGWNGCILLQTEPGPLQHTAGGHQGEIPRVYLQAVSGTELYTTSVSSAFSGTILLCQAKNIWEIYNCNMITYFCHR